MAIARNKKPADVDQAAIAAFGAAAEVRVEAPRPETQAAVAAPQRSARRAKASDEAPPQASLVRWADEEELRDRLIAYRLAERYTMQDLMVKALQLGMDQIEADGRR